MIEPCVRSLEPEVMESYRPFRHLGAEKALLWLECLCEAHTDRGLYLVNGSDEVLTWVKAEAISTITLDDDAFGAGSVPLCYYEVKPGEAVKLDEYDGFYDLDYLLTIAVTICSGNLGIQRFSPSPRKGGLKRQGLVWRPIDRPLSPSLTGKSLHD